MTKICTRVGLVISLLATPASLPAADRTWLEVKTANFTVISDAGEMQTRGDPQARGAEEANDENLRDQPRIHRC